MKKSLAIILLLLSFCFIVCSCADNDKTGDADHTEDTTVGEGNTQFCFEVEGLDGKTVKFTVKTDKTSLADALVENNLIAGEDGPYGLYVKSVNGVEYDYVKDGAYWSLYVDNEVSQVGVSSITIDSSKTYKFKAVRADEY